MGGGSIRDVTAPLLPRRAPGARARPRRGHAARDRTGRHGQDRRAAGAVRPARRGWRRSRPDRARRWFLVGARVDESQLCCSVCPPRSRACTWSRCTGWRTASSRRGRAAASEPPAAAVGDRAVREGAGAARGPGSERWPAYGPLLGMRGFADEVRQFLSRAQEALLYARAARRGGRTRGARGLARAGRLPRRVPGGARRAEPRRLRDPPPTGGRRGAPVASRSFDHVLVDDYQDTTVAAEAILRGLRAPDLVVAANPGAHVFSFQGTSRAPARALHSTCSRARRIVELATNHRAPRARDGRGLGRAAHAARSTRRSRASSDACTSSTASRGTTWRWSSAGRAPHLGGLLRALDDARIPRAMPERGLVARRRARDVAVRARAAVARRRRDRARGAGRAAPRLRRGGALARRRPAACCARLGRRPGSIANALDVTEGLTPAEADAVVAARETLDEGRAVRRHERAGRVPAPLGGASLLAPAGRDAGGAPRRGASSTPW